MARKKKAPAKGTPTFGPKDPKPRPFIGLGFLILGILVALAVGDYNPRQNPLFYSDIEDYNIIGNFGVRVAYGVLFTPPRFLPSGFRTCSSAPIRASWAPAKCLPSY